MTKNFEKQNYGIYGITNTVTGKMYIGQTINSFKSRWDWHRNCLNKNYKKNGKARSNSHLKRAWNKYGEKAFRFDAIEVGPSGLSKEDRLAWCNKREEYWVGDSYLSDDYYNQQSGGDSAIPGPETRRRMSEALKGRPKTKEHRLAMSKARKGKPGKKGKDHHMWGKKQSAESNRKRSATLRANPPFKGRKHTEESKQLLREARLRQENVFTKPIIWIDQDGNEHKFESQVDACKHLGVKSPTLSKAINRGGFSNHRNTMPHLRNTKLIREQ